jgi:CRISPR/Cas system-associated endonuclease Cas1
MPVTLSPDETARSKEALNLLRRMGRDLHLLAEDGRRIHQLSIAHSQESGDVLVLPTCSRDSIPSAANIPQV